MREILFRGKRVDSGEWVEGYFSKWPCVSWKELSCVIVPVIGLENGIAEQAIVDENTAGQWTGLTDKNGVKIFEGDILKWDSDEYGSEYNEICSWDYELLDMRKNDWKEWCEVVGNIHENPELMEGE